MSLTGIQNDIIDNALENFHAAMVIAGEISWNLIESDLNNLVVGFNGKPDPENYFNQTVKDSLVGQSIMAGKDSVNYDNALIDLKEALPVIYEETNQYYNDQGISLKSTAAGYNYEVMAKGLVTTVQNEIDEKLGAAAFNTKVLDPAQNAMTEHLQNGSTKAAIITDMQHRIEDRFYNFSVTTSLTLMQQFTRRLNDIYARYSDSELNWVRYEGPNDSLTRDFCKHRLDDVEGGFYHINEVKDWPKLYSPWVGEIEGTDRGSILVNAGGWGCRHSFVYVLPNDVPKQAIARAQTEGYI